MMLVTVRRKAREVIGELTFLTTTELLDSLLLVMLTVERDANADTSVVLYRLTWFIIVVVGTLISFPLDHEAASTSGDETLKNGGKLLRDLFERALYRLIFTLIKNAN